jgi:hypothetical protein
MQSYDHGRSTQAFELAREVRNKQNKASAQNLEGGWHFSIASSSRRSISSASSSSILSKGKN